MHTILRQTVKKCLNTGDVDVFQAAEHHIYLLMKRDSFPKFSRSQICKDFLDAMLKAQIYVIPPNIMNRWSFDFPCLMKYDYGRYIFRRFLELEMCDENLQFWEAVQDYKSSDLTDQKRKIMANDIIKVFI